MAKQISSDLKKLYKLAIEFYKIHPWSWMWDTDIFSVQNPETGEIGYCCIMGQLGEVLGISVYLGTEGLESYMKMLNAHKSSRKLSDSKSFELYISLKNLSLTFENINDLEKEDKQIIKALNFDMSNKNALPLLRSYRPGYFPWFLEENEIGYFVKVLEQSIDVVVKFKENPDMFKPLKNNTYFTRIFKNGRWEDTWLEPHILITRSQPANIDKGCLEKIKKNAVKTEQIWECDCFRFTEPLKDNQEERPFYPFMFLLVDRDSCFVFTTHLAKPENHINELREHLLSFFESQKMIPIGIAVNKKDTYDLLEPVVKSLGVDLRTEGNLKALQSAKRSMMNHFKKPRPS